MQRQLRYSSSNLTSSVPCARHMLPRCPLARRQPLPSRLPNVIVQAAKSKAKPTGKGFGAPKPNPSGITPESNCPCGSGATYEACCSPYHRGDTVAASPEALLRSRFSAYAAKEATYIADTTHPDSEEYVGSRAAYMGQVRDTMRRLEPSKLAILATEPGSTPDEMFITFRFQRKIKDIETPRNRPEVDEWQERSRFCRIGGRWFYLDSVFQGDEEGQAGAKKEEKKEEQKPKKLLGLF